MKHKNKIHSHITPKTILKYILMTLLFIFVSALSIYILFRSFGKNIDFSEIHIFTRQTVTYLTGLYIVFFTLDTLRMWFILQTIGVKLSIWYTLKLSFISVFVSNITPFQAGGAFAQIFLLNKQGIPVGTAAAATSLKATLASSFFMIIMPFAVMISNHTITMESSHMIFVYVAILLTVYAVYLYLLFKILKNSKYVKAIAYKLFRRLRRKGYIQYKTYKKITHKSLNLIDEYAEHFILFFSGKKTKVILSFLSTILYFISLFGFSVILVRGLGYTYSTLSIMSNQVVANFIMYFGFTPGSAGFAEGGYTFMFSKLVTDFELLALTFYWRLFTVFISAVIGCICFYIEILKYTKVKE